MNGQVPFSKKRKTSSGKPLSQTQVMEGPQLGRYETYCHLLVLDVYPLLSGKGYEEQIFTVGKYCTSELYLYVSNVKG